MSTFNRNIKNLRVSRGFSIQEAAEALRIPYNTYYTYEHQPIQPKFEMLVKICDLYEYKDVYKLITEDICFT
jgi:transcriptional regulator with XRE-family HTH domain